MFVRIRKQPGKEGPIPYAYLVNNEWNGVRKKHEQKIIASLGRVNDLPRDGTIEKMVSALDTFAKKMGWATLTDGIIPQTSPMKRFSPGARNGDHCF